MSTLRFLPSPGSLFIVFRQASGVPDTGTLLPTRLNTRFQFLNTPPGFGFKVTRAFGPGGAVTHTLTAALQANPSTVAAALERSGAAVTHTLTGALQASSATISAALSRAGAPVAHTLEAALQASSAVISAVFNGGGVPVVHELTAYLSADSAIMESCVCVRPDEGIMTYSGTISLTRFNTRRVIDNAYRQCRLNAQDITAEMLEYARDALYLQLSELANGKPPSWCIEQVLLPMYQNQPLVTLPTGTVAVLNMNYRTIQELSGAVTDEPLLYQMQFESEIQVSTVGLKWFCCSTAVSFDTSDDGVTWKQVGAQAGGFAGSHEWTWTDISAPMPRKYFRITSTVPMELEDVVLGNMPNEIPLGVLNRDGYVNQSNKIYPGRPSNFWFQRDLAQPVANLWPAPFKAAEHAQLVLWRHRHVMDVGILTQSLEVPQRWMKSIIASLAATLAAETPKVDPGLIPVLDGKAAIALQIARDGDNDGSPSFYQPSIRMYTR